MTLYDGDPEEGGSEILTRSGAEGEDSLVGFRADLEAALDEAEFASVTFGPRSYTVDLSDSASAELRFNPRGPHAPPRQQPRR